MGIQVFVIYQQQVILWQGTRAAAFWTIDFTVLIVTFPSKAGDDSL
jgi:hypothetical protein